MIGVVGAGVYLLINNHARHNNIASNIQNETVETDANVDVNASENIPKPEQEQESEVTTPKTFNVAFLGELMMGGDIGDTLEYNYMSAFRTISEYTTSADYTVVNLATNVIDLKKIENPKSKYIVTNGIENAFSALGIDGINLASDHMLDFGKGIFKDTVKLLEEDYDLIGMKDKIVYIEHEGIKMAIIGVCNEIIGTQSKYTNAGLMMYNMKNIKAMIKEAKKNVNTVVMLTHLGLENTHEVTNIMSWFYRELVDAGADLVLGSHALGLYPIEIYKGKPIIYSMSNLMSDTDYLKGKESGIFTVTLNKDGKMTALEINPLYINDNKQTVLYSAYDIGQCNNLLQYMTSKLDSKLYNITNNKLVLKIK